MTNKSDMINRRKKVLIVVVIFFIAIIGMSSKSIFAYATKVKEEKAQEIKLAKENKKKELLKEKNNLLSEEYESIKSYIKSKTNGSKDFGIYYENLQNKKVYTYNKNEDFTAASTIKVSLVMSVADKIQKGILSKDGSILYNPSDYEEGSGILQGNMDKLKKPIKYTELMKLAIVYSDNIATQMLFRVNGSVSSYIKNVTGIERKPGGNYITPEQQGKILERLYENKNNNPLYKDIIKNMKNTIFHDRLDKYIPKEITAHKIGDYGSFVHDTGIIFTNRPYILAIYTKGRVDGDEVIANISKGIYDINIQTDKKIQALEDTYNKKINELG